MNARRIVLDRVALAGADAFTALDLVPGSNLVYGASNTGKSFACKAVDFMLGGQRELPDIVERRPYERALLSLTLPQSGQVTLVRSLQGGAFNIVDGLVDSIPVGSNRILSARHDPRSDDNLSSLLLAEIGLSRRQIAVDQSGTKRGLSFRDLAHLCVVDETSIQAERSPVETGNAVTAVAERSVFKLLITGQDDSSVATVMKPRDFKTSKAAKLQIVEAMLQEINDELTADYPHADDLKEQAQRLDETLSAIRSEAEDARVSVRSLIDEKRQISNDLLATRARLADIALNLERFEQLADVYTSDIQRLESLEEAGFLLVLGTDRDCPLCGAVPDSQKHTHGVSEIEASRAAALAEIAKIRLQQAGLGSTVAALNDEQAKLIAAMTALNEKLQVVEASIDRSAPAAEAAQRKLSDLIQLRDHVRHGNDLVSRRDALKAQADELAAQKRVSEPRPKLAIQSSASHEFAQMVGEVLRSWSFPGRLQVDFDDATFDLKIDGKLRRDNGKGVRAVTHSAFKIALMRFCIERDLPHPGFLVLDSPLVTYRDAFTDEEQALKNSSLKQFFFETLAANKTGGQVIVLENVDPPHNITELAHVHAFSGRKGVGRAGFL